jgi:sulfite reductase (NADPH) flavoprotein alpha-component
MSVSQRPPIPSLIPESAPFTPEQRTWLNGLFAGLFGLPENVTPVSNADAAKLLAGLLDGAAGGAAQESNAAEADDGAPWHDPAMPMPDRMKLAADRPLPRRLMAAMAQQDCGQCGYNCKDYADALFAKSEKRLNLCVPGGKETSRMLKQLYQELDGAVSTAVPAAPEATAEAETKSVSAAAPGRSRDNPLYATFLSRRRLNKPGSEKETWHIDIDLAGTDLDYVVGDSFGIFPANDHDLVAAVLAALDVPASFPIGDRTFREVLTDGVSLSPAPDMLFELISYLTGGERRQKAKRLAAGEDPDGDAATLDVLAALHKFAGIRPDPEAFIEALDPLQPRVYSISSSDRCNPGRVSLTVDAVRYQIDKRTRLGVCSTFLGGRVAPGDKVRVYVQKAQHFALPDDPSKPIIMIGPGTGIAPFRAFLHERQAVAAPGRNWLFFGHQHSDYDFFYEDELVAMRASGLLTRLTLAWSRDGKEKTYVQHRMREVARDLWAWIADGAFIYICGDALRMAKDVENALTDVVAEQSGRTADDAAKFIADLKAQGRYQADVYQSMIRKSGHRFSERIMLHRRSKA